MQSDCIGLLECTVSNDGSALFAKALKAFLWDKVILLHWHNVVIVWFSLPVAVFECHVSTFMWWRCGAIVGCIHFACYLTPGEIPGILKWQTPKPIVKMMSFDVRLAGHGCPYNNMLLGPVRQFLPGVACIYMRNDNGNNMTANIITVRQCNMLQLIWLISECSRSTRIHYCTSGNFQPTKLVGA